MGSFKCANKVLIILSLLIVRPIPPFLEFVSDHQKSDEYLSELKNQNST
jgi:hypothetical protein